MSLKGSSAFLARESALDSDGFKIGTDANACSQEDDVPSIVQSCQASGMCGITVLLAGCSVNNLTAQAQTDVDESGTLSQASWPILDEHLRRRGPDSCGCEEVQLGPAATLQLQGSILQLRGRKPANNPVKDNLRNILVFNGEIFGGLSVPAGSNDTQALLQALTQDSVQEVFNSLRGPWAAVYWQHSSRTLWFGKDVLGRRSLLVHSPAAADDTFCLTSTAPASTASPCHHSADLTNSEARDLLGTPHVVWQELKPGLYSLHIPEQSSPNASPLCTQLEYHSWHEPQLCSIRDLQRPCHLIEPSSSGLSCNEAKVECLPSGSIPQVAASKDVWSSGTNATEHFSAQSHLTEANAGDVSSGSKAIMGSPSNIAQVDPMTLATHTAGAATQPIVSASGNEVTTNVSTSANTEATTKHTPQMGDGASLHSQCTSSAQQHQQFQKAVQLMLTALRRSVALRCQCIDDHGQLDEQSALSDHADTPAVPTQRLPLPVAAEQERPVQERSTHHNIPEHSYAAHTPHQYAMDYEAQLQHQQVSTRQDCASQQRDDEAQQPQPAQRQGGPEPQQQHQHLTADPQAAALTEGLEQTPEQLEPAPVLILFSGGVDSTLIAALAHESLPGHVPIDLASVCFQGGKSTDRLAAQDAVQELAAFAPAREWRLIEVDSSLSQVDQHRQWLLGLLYPSATIMDVNIGAALWMAAQAEGKLTIIKGSAAATSPSQPPTHANPSPNTLCHHQQQQQDYMTNAQQQNQTLAEESGASPQQALLMMQQHDPVEHVAQMQHCSEQWYRSAARVVLLGHGADEQHAGYGRHRTSFRNQGWQGLQQELVVDMLRLWQRNLGRDDRLVADTSREARHPFLDEDYISTVLSLPLWLVADLRQPPGVGDKRLLRAALIELGLPRAAARVKRAIQFGTGIGKLSNIRAFGSNRAADRKNAGSLSLNLLSSSLPV